MANCLKCDKLFADSSNLNRHTKMVHKEVYTDPEDSEEENETADEEEQTKRWTLMMRVMKHN